MKRSFALLLFIIMIFAGCSTKNESNIPLQQFSADQKSIHEIKIIKGVQNKENPAKKRSNAKDTLIVGVSEVKGDFLPIYYNSVYDGYVVSLIFTPLLTNDSSGNLTPALAKEMPQLSSDKKTYTITLRKGVTFSDGTDLTAKDVAFTYTILCDPSFDGRSTDIVNNLEGYEEYNKDHNNDIKNVSGIKIIDDYTISFTFKEPLVSNISNFTLGIMPASKYSYKKGNTASIRAKMDNPIGSGPYKMVKFEPRQYIEFTANERYFKGQPKIPKLIMKFTTVDTMLQELSKGTIDIQTAVPPRPENFEIIKQSGNLDMVQYPDNAYGYIGFNLRDLRLSDKRVRQALIYGFDRQQFVDIYYKGYAQVCNAPLSQVSWAYTQELGDKLNTYQYNPDLSNKMLDEAGWKVGKDGVREKNGKRLEFTLSTYLHSKYVDILIPVLKEYWKRIGVKVNPDLMEFNALVEKIYTKRDFDMYNMSWSLTPDPGDSFSTFHSSFDMPDANNSIGFRNLESDWLLEEGRRQFNQQKRKDIYTAWGLLINDQVPYMFLNQNLHVDVINNRIKNLVPTPFEDWTYHIEQVELIQ